MMAKIKPNNEIDNIALPILEQILTEAQDVWKNPNSKYKDYRNLQIDKRGSFGERFFKDILMEIYKRRVKLEYNDGDQGDWDLKFNDVKFEIKTSSLDVNGKFQNEGLKKSGDYNGILFLGVAPDSLYFRCLKKDNFNFDKLEVRAINGEFLTHLHNRGNDDTGKKATGAGYKCDFKLKDMIELTSLLVFQNEFEKYFKKI